MANKNGKMQKSQPPQEQARQPGRQDEMRPEPLTIREDYKGSGKLEGKVALITGGDSGIGRSVAVHFAREGADVAIVYLEEDDDARTTKQLIEDEGRRCLLITGDIGDPATSKEAVSKTFKELGGLDILVNNAGEQHTVEAPEELEPEQIERTFKTNVFGCYHMMNAALPKLKEGAAIINTGSVTGAQGHAQLLDYAATKGAIHAMTFSFAQVLAERGIRVNAVAPGPIWTPLIPASFDAEDVGEFGQDTLMKRPGQPAEVAPAYVFLASQDASFITGQIIHVNGGSLVGA